MEITENDDVPVKANTYKLLTACGSTVKEDLSKIFHDLQDEKHPKLTIGMFFQFMKTAYQVNESFESLTTMLNTDNEIPWTKLANINCNVKTCDDNVKNNGKYLISNTICKDDDTSDAEHILLDNQIKDTKGNFRNTLAFSPSISSKFHCKDEKLNFSEVDNPENCCSDSKTILNSGEVDHEEYNKISANQLSAEETQIFKSVDATENIITTMMKTHLSDVLHEGLLDSVLPYMIPKPALSQPIIKKSLITSEMKKSTSLCNNVESRISSYTTHKEKDREKSKLNRKYLENEVEIHVSDEEKNIKRNFRCPQKLLIQKMCYFADVTAGQKLEEIDISVHCDVVIFDWLMRWVKKDIIKKSEWPSLEANNVIPIMVSASFLQMEPLLESCLQYCYDNMSDILKTSTILTCLDDNLLGRLAERFTNEDVEALKDKRDKIQSKLFCKLIILLAEVIPDNKKGHYSSLATLFKCSKCGKHIIQSVSNSVSCISSAMKIDHRGIVQSKHVRDLTWSLNDYILALRMELRSWRKVYWRLWGDCHFLYCTLCDTYFPIHQMDWCCYHSELPQFFINEQQRPVPFPLGRYPCCSQRAYRFEALPNQEGCRYREHVPDVRTEKEVNILNIFTVHREVIAMEPPQLFFPEKITRLVARDPSLEPGRLICKDIMRWTGIELVPQRSRLGLLGKIWSNSGLKRFTQTEDIQRSLPKLRQQISTTTDVSSPTSSAPDSDETDSMTYYENSSIDEESYYSEESNIWPISKQFNKTPKKTKNPAVCRSSVRFWSGNLNVRHNQDNQRDFEERAVMQMTALLTKRVSTNSAVLLKSSSKQGWKKKQPAGGIYAKLEAEFRELLNQSCRYKSLIGKSARIKSTKL